MEEIFKEDVNPNEGKVIPTYQVSETTAKMIHGYDTICSGISQILSAIGDIYGDVDMKVIEKYCPCWQDYQDGILALIANTSIALNRAESGSNQI